MFFSLTAFKSFDAVYEIRESLECFWAFDKSSDNTIVVFVHLFALSIGHFIPFKSEETGIEDVIVFVCYFNSEDSF